MRFTNRLVATCFAFLGGIFFVWHDKSDNIHAEDSPPQTKPDGLFKAHPNYRPTLAVLADAQSGLYGDLLTAALSEAGFADVVERNEIEKIFTEQGRNATGKSVDPNRSLQLGKILKADGVVLITQTREGRTNTVSARLLVVQSGVVIDSIRTAAERKAKDPSQWSRFITSKIYQQLDKFQVRRQDAIPLSILNFRSTLPTPAGLEAEAKLYTLLHHRLAREPRLFLLEREKLGLLQHEKEFALQTSTEFWSGAFILDGSIEPDPKHPERFRLVARLSEPKTKKEKKIERTGTLASLPEFTQEIAEDILKAVSVQTSHPQGNLEAEARLFAEEAKWAFGLYQYGLCARSSEAAFALGASGTELATPWMESLLKTLPLSEYGVRTFAVRLNYSFPLRNVRPFPIPEPFFKSESLHQAMHQALYLLHLFNRLIDGWEGDEASLASFALTYGPPALDRALTIYQRALPDDTPQNISWRQTLKARASFTLNRLLKRFPSEEDTFKLECIQLFYIADLFETDSKIIAQAERALAKEDAPAEHKSNSYHVSDLESYFDAHGRQRIADFSLVKDLLCEVLKDREEFYNLQSAEWTGFIDRLRKHDDPKKQLLGWLFQHERSDYKGKAHCLESAKKIIWAARDQIAQNVLLYADFNDTLQRMDSKQHALFRKGLSNYWDQRFTRIYPYDYRKFMADLAVYIYEKGPYIPGVLPPFRTEPARFSAHQIKKVYTAYLNNLHAKGPGHEDYGELLSQIQERLRKIDRVFPGLFAEHLEDQDKLLIVHRAVVPAQEIFPERYNARFINAKVSRSAKFMDGKFWTIVRLQGKGSASKGVSIDEGYIWTMDFLTGESESIRIPDLKFSGPERHIYVDPDGVIISGSRDAFVAWYNLKSKKWFNYTNSERNLFPGRPFVQSDKYIYVNCSAVEKRPRETRYAHIGMLRLDKNTEQSRLIVNKRRKPAVNPVDQENNFHPVLITSNETLIIRSYFDGGTNFFGYHPSDGSFTSIKRENLPAGMPKSRRSKPNYPYLNPNIDQERWRLEKSTIQHKLSYENKGTGITRAIPLVFDEEPEFVPHEKSAFDDNRKSRYLPNSSRLYFMPSGLLIPGSVSSGGFCYWYLPYSDIEAYKTGDTRNPAVRVFSKAPGWFAAVVGGRLPDLQNLLRKGEDINQRDANNQTALMIAAQKDLHETARFLIDHGADIDLAGPDDNTALRYAASAADSETFFRLLDAGAKWDKENSTETSLACLTAAIGQHEKMIKLLELGGSPNWAKDPKNILFAKAIKSGRNQGVHYLLDNGAQVNTPDEKGTSPLMLYTYRGDRPMVQRLINQGADLNYQNYKGESALSEAASFKNCSMFEQLLKAGAKIDPTTKEAARKWGGPHVRELVEGIGLGTHSFHKRLQL